MRPSNKGMKLTKPGELRSFAAYPRNVLDARGLLPVFDGYGAMIVGDARA
jgi:hypothetical protein